MRGLTSLVGDRGQLLAYGSLSHHCQLHRHVVALSLDLLE